MKVLQSEESGKKVVFHAYDRKILALLCRNVRLPLAKIAQLLRLSRQSVEYRIKVMEKAHVIAGSRTVVNIQALGYQSYHYFFALHSGEAEKILRERALSSGMVNALITYSGRTTHELSIMARSPSEAQNHFLFLTEGLSLKNVIPVIILSTVKASVLPELQSEKLPVIRHIRNDPSFSKQFTLPTQSYIADEKDLVLLYLLSQDAHLSLSELGKKTQLSSDAVSYRIKKLIRGDYIKEFRPVINFDALSYSVQAVLMKAKRSSKEDLEFKNYLNNDLNVLWATEVFGEWDYLLYVINHSQDEIHAILNGLQKTFPDYVSSYELFFAYQEHKYAFMTEAMKKI
ncbi:MAG: winged helix-turn-helix transcriptional regulator [Nanoarchaeota archaeon]